MYVRVYNWLCTCSSNQNIYCTCTLYNICVLCVALGGGRGGLMCNIYNIKCLYSACVCVSLILANVPFWQIKKCFRLASSTNVIVHVLHVQYMYCTCSNLNK